METYKDMRRISATIWHFEKLRVMAGWPQGANIFLTAGFGSCYHGAEEAGGKRPCLIFNRLMFVEKP
jgi:hypothetical protein